MSGSGATYENSLRVSVATLNRVIFPHPQSGAPILALERKATILNQGQGVRVRAQPFGGGVHIKNPIPLQELIGDLQFDSERSQHEGDFRLLISPSDWEPVKRFCLQHLKDPDDPDLEALPHRELAEEFVDVLGVRLMPDQYTVQPAGFVIENDPTPTDNVYMRGQLSVRCYRIFEVCLVDENLCTTMLASSERYSDQDAMKLAWEDFRRSGMGRANILLTIPLSLVTDAYRSIPLEKRYTAVKVDDHLLDESVLAVLEDIEVAQHQRFSE